MEITSLLNEDVHTGEQVAENYAYLIDKYGEWVVVGADGGMFQVKFVDIRKALFSGLMVVYLVLTVVSLAISVIIGKVLFPKLSQFYKDSNQDMVDLATLQTNAEIAKKRKKEEDWF